MDVLKLHMACVCHMGRVRGNNEDNFYFGGERLEENNTGLDAVLCYTAKPWQTPETVAVFDGMGGEMGGEMAAFAAASALGDILSVPNVTELSAVIQSLNRAVCATGVTQRMKTAGCTAVLARFQGDAVSVANVGDSPAFLFRDGQLEQLSQAHTDAQLLLELGITNRKPRLTQYLGIDPEELVLEPYVTDRTLRGGDIIVLCSDGLTDMLSWRELAGSLACATSAEKLARDLLQAALRQGGRDNTTIVVAVVEA